MNKKELLKKEDISNKYLLELFEKKKKAKKNGDKNEASRLHALIRAEQKKKNEVVEEYHRAKREKK